MTIVEGLTRRGTWRLLVLAVGMPAFSMAVAGNRLIHNADNTTLSLMSALPLLGAALRPDSNSQHEAVNEASNKLPNNLSIDTFNDWAIYLITDSFTKRSQCFMQFVGDNIDSNRWILDYTPDLGFILNSLAGPLAYKDVDTVFGVTHKLDSKYAARLNGYVMSVSLFKPNELSVEWSMTDEDVELAKKNLEASSLQIRVVGSGEGDAEILSAPMKGFKVAYKKLNKLHCDATLDVTIQPQYSN